MDALVAGPPPGMARIGIVCGSGIELRGLLDAVYREWNFRELGLSTGGVSGHRCSFILGRSGASEVLLQQGRLHLYEGRSRGEILAPLQLQHTLGVTRCIFTNATGAIHPELEPGSLVSVTEMFAWPCTHPAMGGLPSHVSPSFLLPGLEVRGTYCWVHGPCYETRAEIAALRHMGADLVGMSTLLELHAAVSLGVPAAVVSCVTNACGGGEKLCHGDVVSVAGRASAALCERLRAALAQWEADASGGS